MGIGSAMGYGADYLTPNQRPPARNPPARRHSSGKNSPISRCRNHGITLLPDLLKQRSLCQKQPDGVVYGEIGLAIWPSSSILLP